MPAPHPEVLIVGRPNVGKSTLFNRLAGKSLAIVDDRPGSTRDLKSFDIFWNNFTFTLTDSGGWVPGEKESIAMKVGEMLEKRIRNVSALLFLMDGIEGVTPADKTLVRAIRKYGIPTWLLVNKSDRPEKRQEMLSDFLSLGFTESFPISASHGLGIDDFLDSLTTFLQGSDAILPEEEAGPRKIRLAVLGKPNVGKSSLVNTILGENRLIVDDLPGTTHDAIPVIIETEGEPLVMIDTAGIRAKKHHDTHIETMSVEQTFYELQTCQVALLLIDGEKGVTHQDVAISRIISEAFRPVVVLVNKWDIHPLGAEQARAERIVRRQLRHLNFAPVLFISAKTHMNLERVLPAAFAVYEESCKQIPTRKVNLSLQEAISKHSPPFKNGHALKILYGYQRQGHPPAFEIFVNHAASATPSYLRYLESEIRPAFEMTTTPLQLVLKEKPDDRVFKRPTFKRNFKQPHRKSGPPPPKKRKEEE